MRELTYFEPENKTNLEKYDKIHIYSRETGLYPYVFFYKFLAKKPDGNEE